MRCTGKLRLRDLFVTGLIAVTSLGVFTERAAAISDTSLFTAIDVSVAGTSALQGTAVTALDPAGDATGVYIDANSAVHGFVRLATGTVARFDAPGAAAGRYQGTFPTVMDTAGDVSGIYTDSNNVTHGFFRTAAGTITTITAAGAGSDKSQGTFPTCMNGTGQVAGVYIDATNIVHGFVRSADGAITPFDAAANNGANGDFFGTFVVAIDATGNVAGAFVTASTKIVHGFIRATGGAITNIDAPNAGTAPNLGTAITAIDAAGDVTGFYLDAKNMVHGFVVPSGGAFTAIDALGAGTGNYEGTYPTGIDAKGDVGGMYTDANNIIYGFFRSASSGLITSYSAPGTDAPATLIKGSAGKHIGRNSKFGGLLQSKHPVTFLGKVMNLLGKVETASPVSDTTPGIGIGSSGLYYGTGNFGNLFFNAMNASGAITGINLDVESVVHTYLRTPDGAITVINAPNAGTASEQGTGGLAINAAGTIAGTYVDSSTVLHGFIFAPSLLATTTTLTPVPSPNPSVYQEPVTLTAVVSSSSGAPPNGENVTFMSGATQLGTATLTGGTATLTITSLPVGTDSINAAYTGDMGLSGSASASVNQTVNKATSTTTLTSSLNPSTFGQSVKLTANISGQFSGTATGTVIFNNGSTALGTVDVSNNSASLSLSTLPVATNSLTAAYSGDSNFTGSTSATLPQVVNASPVATPTFSPVAGTYTSVQSVTISDTTPNAVIYYTTNGTTPTTSSSVFSNSVSVGVTETLEAIATATGYATSAVGTAPYTINLPPNPAPVLSGVSPAFISAGNAAFTLTVTGTGFTPSSTVDWSSAALATTYVNATQLTAQVPAANVASGGITATVTVVTPTPGGGTSSSFQFEVNSGASSGGGVTITTSTQTVTAGSPATYPITVPSGVSSVSVICLNLPTGATCTYSSTTGAVSIATSASTPTGTYLITVVVTETLAGAATGAIFLPLLLLPLVTLRKKLSARGIWSTACLGLIMIAITAFGIGCGGGGASSTPATHQATASGSVTLTIH